MLFTSAACFGSQLAKLHSRDSDAPRHSSTSVLQAPHCCTASLQDLQTQAAVHRMRGAVLSAGCSNAIDSPAGALDDVSCSQTGMQSTQQQQEEQQQAQ
jgi:hypothetical protein